MSDREDSDNVLREHQDWRSTHPANCIPPELQAAHYIKQILELREFNRELLTALKETVQEFVDKGGHDIAASVKSYAKAISVIAKEEKLK